MPLAETGIDSSGHVVDAADAVLGEDVNMTVAVVATLLSIKKLMTEAITTVREMPTTCGAILVAANEE